MTDEEPSGARIGGLGEESPGCTEGNGEKGSLGASNRWLRGGRHFFIFFERGRLIIARHT